MDECVSSMFRVLGFRCQPSKINILLFFVILITFTYVFFFNFYVTKEVDVKSSSLRPEGLKIKGENFTFMRKPYRILSGSIHYFRIPRHDWDDRILKMKAMGLNTVDVYIPWNLHEPTPGKYNFDGDLHLRSFLNLVETYGLWAIVRPGPYICAEWDLGGLPSWLLSDKDMKLRSTYKPYMDAVDRYFKELFTVLTPLQFSRGGPIIAFQIENEYGSYGNDVEYMESLKRSFVKNGVEELLFVCDNLQGVGKYKMDGVLQTINFGTKDVKRGIEVLKKHQPDKPVFVTEFWDGWFDHWGEKHHVVDAKKTGKALKEILDLGASFNLYMWHGGTNFGFLNGANANDDGSNYQPTITSYDYNAPLSEAGDVTEKYDILRDVIKKSAPKSVVAKKLPWFPEDGQGYTIYDDIEFENYMTMTDLLASKLIDGFTSSAPLSMEMLPSNENAGQSYGYIVYEKTLNGKTSSSETLIINNARDFVLVVLNGDVIFTGSVKIQKQIRVRLDGRLKRDGSNIFHIFVENCGRVNYGRDLNNQRKGILGKVFLGKDELLDWTIYPLEFHKDWVKEHLTSSKIWHDVSKNLLKDINQPTLYKAQLYVHAAPQNTILELPGWFKGVVFMNGYNLGRYWNIGPQKTLYVPKHWLRMRNNTVILFDMKGHNADQKQTPKLLSTNEHDLGESNSAVMVT